MSDGYGLNFERLRHALRTDLPPMPPAIARRPVYEGYPVPWFARYGHDDTGRKPDPRGEWEMARRLAVQDRRCWFCGLPIAGPHLAFVLDPSAVITQISLDPAFCIDCAIWSARACPHLVHPVARRRELGDGPDPVSIVPQVGVVVVWITRGCEGRQVKGGLVFAMDRPTKIAAFLQGRPATKEAIRGALEEAYPSLLDRARKMGADTVLQLSKQRGQALRRLGVEP